MKTKHEQDELQLGEESYSRGRAGAMAQLTHYSFPRADANANNPNSFYRLILN
jgi:hypothetical protein